MITQTKPRGRPPKNMLKNGRCRFFKKGKDGFCKYYAGNKRYLESCYNKCLKRRDQMGEKLKAYMETLC